MGRRSGRRAWERARRASRHRSARGLQARLARQGPGGFGVLGRGRLPGGGGGGGEWLAGGALPALDATRDGFATGTVLVPSWPARLETVLGAARCRGSEAD